MQLEFCEPPPVKMGGSGRRNNQLFLELAAELRKHPGRWAIWPFDHGSAYTVATHVNLDRYASLPAAEFEALVRARRVYIRARSEDSGQG